MLGQVVLTATCMWAVLLQAGSPQTQRSEPAQPVVTLDFMATDRDGPIRDLAAGDVTLKVGGKVRPLLALDTILTSKSGRDILLLVDEATLFGLEPVVKDAVSKLLATLEPTDRISYASGRRETATPLSENHSLVMGALEKMVTGPGVLMACLADVVTAIDAYTRSLPPGRSTTFAVLSRGSAEISPCPPRREALYLLGDLVSAAQINLLLMTVHQNTRSWGMDSLATTANGQSGLLTFANADALARAVAETSWYYRATFAADEKAPPRTQRVELRVNRPKVKLRTSPGIMVAPRPGPTSD